MIINTHCSDICIRRNLGNLNIFRKRIILELLWYYRQCFHRCDFTDIEYVYLPTCWNHRQSSHRYLSTIIAPACAIVDYVSLFILYIHFREKENKEGNRKEVIKVITTYCYCVNQHMIKILIYKKNPTSDL